MPSSLVYLDEIKKVPGQKKTIIISYFKFYGHFFYKYLEDWQNSLELAQISESGCNLFEGDESTQSIKAFLN